jgi:hypothetical protein
LIALCEKLNIDYIFPAYDDVIVALARETSRLSAVLLTAPLDTCILTRSKRQTYLQLDGIIRVPRLFHMEPTEIQYPVFLKPNTGQGSQGAYLIQNKIELDSLIMTIKDPIICEYLPGPEYTVDCFSDREKGLLFSGARVRRRMRNGIAVNTLSVTIPGIKKIASTISDKLKMRGAWFFQVKESADGELVLLEVAPRIAGSMSTHRAQGVNFPLLTIFEHERKNIGILINEGVIELDRALKNRFRTDISYKHLYIDLDDTILIANAVNIDAINLIYKCINKGIKVILITRHDGDLIKTLSRFRLLNLFDEILHITDGRLKSDYIKESDSIFVDDSYSERVNVNKVHRIKTFDCSMLEVLVDSL